MRTYLCPPGIDSAAQLISALDMLEKEPDEKVEFHIHSNRESCDDWGTHATVQACWNSDNLEEDDVKSLD